jgi:hypothetical protein
MKVTTADVAHLIEALELTEKVLHAPNYQKKMKKWRWKLRRFRSLRRKLLAINARLKRCVHCGRKFDGPTKKIHCSTVCWNRRYYASPKVKAHRREAGRKYMREYRFRRLREAHRAFQVDLHSDAVLDVLHAHLVGDT